MSAQNLSFTLSITIDNVLTLPTGIVAPIGTVGQPYSFQLPSPSGGIAPYVWSGSPAGGLSVTPGGLISGTPTNVGTIGLNLTVTDSAP